MLALPSFIPILSLPLPRPPRARACTWTNVLVRNQECARKVHAEIRFIPSYQEMVRAGYSVLADAVRSRKGGIIGLLDLWDGPCMVIKGSANDVRRHRRLFRPSAAEHHSRRVNARKLVRGAAAGEKEVGDMEERRADSDEEADALMCGFLDSDEPAPRVQQRARPRVMLSSSDEELEGDLDYDLYGQDDAEEERLELPYVHKELDLGPEKGFGSCAIDGETGTWQISMSICEFETRI